jgi:hypothetical protein
VATENLKGGVEGSERDFGEAYVFMTEMRRRGKA